MIGRDRKYPLHVYLSILFVTLTLVFSGVTIALQDHNTRQTILAAADTLFNHLEGETRENIQTRYDEAVIAADLLASTTLSEAKTLSERLNRLGALAQPLQDRNFSAAFVGYRTGDLFLIRRLPAGSEIARSLAAPARTAFLVQSVTETAPGQREGRYLFFDAGLGLLENRLMPDEKPDPRERLWFRDAIDRDGPIVTAPYRFITTDEAGFTAAYRSEDRQSVGGIDVGLGSLAKGLEAMRPTRSAVLLILDGNGNIIAEAGQTLPAAAPGTSELKLPTVGDPGRSVAAELFAQRPDSGSRALRIRQPDGIWQGFVSALSQPGGTLYLAIAAPHAELLADAEWIRDRGLLVAVVLLVIAVLCTFLVSRLAARQLDALTAEAKLIRALRFDQPITVRSPIAEIDTLAVTMAEMKSTIRRFLEIGAVLAGERNFERLLDRILTGTISLTAARGGIVYLTERDGSLTSALARWKDEPIDNPAPAIDARQSEHPAIRALREGSVMLQASGAEASAWFAALGHREPLATVAVPLRNRQAEPLGSLVLLYDTALPDDTGQRDMLGMVEAVSGAAASAIESQRLLREQKLLLQSFIELVAGAIDRKSPYTGGHCQRVPELTKMIARAAEAATAGPFAGFALNEQQWEELHIAAWLHDCGKVTSPEYVIDKATKLETIYDRLHEVRMRFEVVKREAEVACWRAIADGADRKLRLRELRAIWAELDEEFVFVAACNEGGEYMSPDRVERLKQIARRTWTRTLDDRIGLSEDEKRRKSRTPAAALPAVEPLLADRPDHIFERRDSDRIAPDNPWGIRVEVPEHLYNRGEIHNLSVSRGTLTAEDRYKINEHMVETVRMLSLLPLPSHLANVPEIACGHHEKMDGTGYPRRLKRDEMSVPARMMAIADIFEALTAADRPYKQGKKLSEALTIMARMRDDRHIDPDIFALFLRAGVYRDFAERHLAPAQIDHVDIADYLVEAVSTA